MNKTKTNHTKTNKQKTFEKKKHEIKNHTIGTVPKSNTIIVVTEKCETQRTITTLQF